MAVATINQIIRKAHVPGVGTLFRLADYFEVPREESLRLAGHMPPDHVELEAASSPDPEGDFLIREWVEEFRKVPDAWKEETIAQVAMFARSGNHPPYRINGQDEDEDHRESATTGA